MKHWLNRNVTVILVIVMGLCLLVMMATMAHSQTTDFTVTDPEGLTIDRRVYIEISYMSDGTVIKKVTSDMRWPQGADAEAQAITEMQLALGITP